MKSPWLALEQMENTAMQRLLPAIMKQLCGPACVTALLVSAATCSATTISFTEAGASAAGTPLLVSARFDTAADAGGDDFALRITLRSFGALTVFKEDVLSSLYFNLADPDDGVRPTLTYLSGTGRAYEVLAGTTDRPVSWSPNLLASSGTWTTSGSGVNDPSNLVAIQDFNEGWQFKTLTPPPAYPGLGFGIGTVGNSNIGAFVPGASGSIGGFDGRVVRGAGRGDTMINLGIYSTGTSSAFVDITPSVGLDGARLVRSEAVFTFRSDRNLSSVDQNWVQGNVTFGFGTGPDSVLLPEPGSLSIASLGGLFAAAWLLRKRKRLRADERTRGQERA